MSHCFSTFCRDVRSRPIHPTHLTIPLINILDQAQKLEVASVLIFKKKIFKKRILSLQTFISFHYFLEGSYYKKYTWMKSCLH